jgi:hypothetical protein
METAKALKGSARRLFLARTVQVLGEGGQRLAERELQRRAQRLSFHLTLPFLP